MTVVLNQRRRITKTHKPYTGVSWVLTSQIQEVSYIHPDLWPLGEDIEHWFFENRAFSAAKWPYRNKATELYTKFWLKVLQIRPIPCKWFLQSLNRSEKEKINVFSKALFNRHCPKNSVHVFKKMWLHKDSLVLLCEILLPLKPRNKGV